MTLLLRESDVQDLLTIETAVDAVRRSFELLADGRATNYPRQRGGSNSAVLNVMWAVSPAIGAMGSKTYPIVRTDVTQFATSTLVLFGLPAGELQLVAEADVLGQIRTGAASAVATSALARPDSVTLTVFGAGWQAYSQVLAVAHVLPELERVLVVGRTPERITAFVEGLQSVVRAEVRPESPEQAVRAADVLVTATGTVEPLFSGEWLRPGTHINAIGSNYREKREIDGLTVDRADVVVVDSIDVARLESGDLLQHTTDWEQVVELGPIVAGYIPGRGHEDAITLFESHGLAIQDVVCGVEVLKTAHANSRGIEIPFGNRTP